MSRRRTPPNPVNVAIHGHAAAIEIEANWKQARRRWRRILNATDPAKQEELIRRYLGPATPPER